jgi:protein AATF/BFR2
MTRLVYFELQEAASEGQVDEAQEIAATVIDRDPETYDDGEFYQNLLKEFLEAKQVGGSSAKWSSGTKHRKIVDRRASKGRKLRYHVHDKLVNFTAPVELSAPQFASNVFANLFGGVGRR